MSNNSKFQADLKHSADVKREDMQSELAAKANKQLREIGDQIKPVQGIEYVGSAAVHVYKSEIAGNIYFISQVGTLGECNEALAQAAFKDLAGSAMEYFGRKRPVTRSGF